ncbi:DUF2782 domain-containing protein [Sulfurivermis fontis]|jgi:hypothetical protein|uniref:DUF2782 domain-containing protein n=1 Tax=Sulfurivermis fontis TaxID=1972068 RepID=UPI000FDBAA85|nr:DUF2782 domain-containing protein [Sulfurivermis fontis]
MRPTFLAAALLLIGYAHAAGQLDPLPPPPLPDAEAVEEAEELQPEVTIRSRGDATVEEYRVNGRLYMVKISPSRGYPYYLIDSDGDGSFETRRNELDPPNINQWILFRW